MPYFGPSSMRRLHTLHEHLKFVLTETIEYIDFSIICGHRSEKEQNEAFANRKSTLKWPESKHNTFPSLAVDVAPYYKVAPHIRWERRNEFIYLHGFIISIARRRGIILRSGNNWDMDDELITDQTFIDLPHLELIL